MKLGKYEVLSGTAQAVAARSRSAIRHTTPGDCEAHQKRERSRVLKVMVFPELSVTGYTCADLFNQNSLLAGAQSALAAILEQTAGCEVSRQSACLSPRTTSCITAPSSSMPDGFSPPCPKTFIPNYNEFYEKPGLPPLSRGNAIPSGCACDVPFGEKHPV
jgi:NAD+ synthase (glutamine-hydrolysing)